VTSGGGGVVLAAGGGRTVGGMTFGCVPGLCCSVAAAELLREHVRWHYVPTYIWYPASSDGWYSYHLPVRLARGSLPALSFVAFKVKVTVRRVRRAVLLHLGLCGMTRKNTRQEKGEYIPGGTIL
jgi:hypothetical protein